MRCSGKSTAGVMLAQRLATSFADTDRGVEQNLKTTIEELFAQGRESEFREVEEEICIRMLKEGGVVSLGGGAIVSARVRRALWSVMTVYMDASESLIASRLEHGGRPSLTGQPAAVEAIEISRRRRPWYMDVADFVIHVDGKETEQICDEIMKCVTGIDKREPQPDAL